MLTPLTPKITVPITYLLGWIILKLVHLVPTLYLGVLTGP